MRTAINTYQSGGVFYEPLPLTPAPTQPTPQASPVQPPPGAAGPTPTPSPPDEFGATAPAATPPTAAPPTAITTAPPQQAPAPFTDHDRDVDTAERSEGAVFNEGHIYSHRGDNRDISIKPDPNKLDLTKHRDYEKISRAGELIQQMPEGKEKNDYKRWFKSEMDRINRDTQRNATAEARRVHDAERQELTGIDAKNTSQTTTEQYNDKLNMVLTGITQDRDKDLAVRDPAQLHLNQAKWQASALNPNVMQPDVLRQVARNIQALNQNLDATQSMQLAIRLAQSTAPGQKGSNGLVGRGAANYVPHGVDLIGNRFLNTDYGLIRVGMGELNQLKQARKRSYDERLKFQSDLDKARTEEAKPGLVGRTLKSLGLQ